MNEDPFTRTLSEEIDRAAALAVPDGSWEPRPGFVERASRLRRRRTVTIAVGGLCSLVLAAAGIVRLLDDPAPRVEVVAAPPLGGLASGSFTVDEVAGSIDPASPLARLRLPSVTPFDDGFLIWGGTSTDADPLRRDGPTTTLQGENGSGVGAVFSDGTWRMMAASPLAARAYHAAVWTGQELVVAGGSTSLQRRDPREDVAAYSPSTDTWRSLEPLPVPRTDAAAVALEGVVVIAGGDTPTGPNTSTVLLGTGSEPWSTIMLEHPVSGAFTAGNSVIAYGFDGETALALSQIDPSTAAVKPLPEVVHSGVVSSYGIGPSGTSITAALATDLDVTLYRLGIGDAAWRSAASFSVDEKVFGVNRFYPWANAGVVIVTPTVMVSTTPEGIYRIRLPDGEVESLKVAPRCGNSSTSALSPGAAMFWVDGSCPTRHGAWVVTTR